LFHLKRICFIIADMNTLMDIVKKRQNPGILIFDADCKLTYANNEVLDILPAKEGKKPKNFGKNQIPVEIYSLCDQLKTNLVNNQNMDAECSVLVNHSGVSCAVRAMLLKNSASNEPTHIMVLIERIAEKHEFDFEIAKAMYHFSKREIDVLKLLCNGEGNRKIGEKLFISEYTVKDHIKNILRKMGVNSRNEIIAILK
jgi:DNA-binding CsgD family transcriptional regulator